MSQTPALIGLDWGISQLRIYAIGGDGGVLSTDATGQGILAVPDGEFEATFRRSLAAVPGAADDTPIIASGMIGSRQGWVEVPYVGCPAGLAEIAAGLARHRAGDGRLLYFVPGLSLHAEAGTPDIMRGEETQIVGAIARGADGLMVLPGSHSKWAFAEAGRISWFATFMTGEIYAILKEHSILGRLMAEPEAFDTRAFARGLEGAAAEGGLLQRLFSARTLALFDRLAAPEVPDYLSGLLIGTEVSEALSQVSRQEPSSEITVIGGDALTARYLAALAHFGLPARAAEPAVTATGLYAIARQAGLLEASP